MDYSVGRKIPVQRVTATPHAVAVSSCNVLAAVTLQGIHLFVSCFLHHFTILISALFLFHGVLANEFTDEVFPDTKGSLAAFGDFNSDKLTDAFIIQSYSFEILLAYPEPPYLRKEHLTCSFKEEVAAIVPGDFDGDGAMDVLVLTKKRNPLHFDVHVAWGALTKLECSIDPLITTYGHPLMLDYNQDMIADLFGLDLDQKRTFWIFNSSRAIDHTIRMEANHSLRIPHSHGFADLDGDLSADLLLSGENGYELWRRSSQGTFELSKTIPLPIIGAAIIGQSVFLDLNFDGKLDHLVPVCFDFKCTNASFYVFFTSSDKWQLIDCDFKDPKGEQWTLHPPDASRPYLDTLTARSGDFNLDGYPDLLVTLVRPGKTPRAILLENSEAGRKFTPRWGLLSEWNTTSVIASAFYDVQEKGLLDILLVLEDGRMAAYKNSLDYDTNFIKVMVLTGRCYANCSHGHVPYGTNLPGPSVSYRTIQLDEKQLAVAAQLSQSAYHSLQLPYTLFGLGRSPNFLEFLQVGLDRVGRQWTQIIPNSQMIIIPTLDGQPASWLNKLFVTPSRAIVLSAAALAGFGILLAVAVLVLHCRERRADRLEQLAVANRFHFDAM